MIEGSGIKRDLKLAGLGHEILLLQLTTIPRLPAITTLHWESCLSFAVRMPVRVFYSETPDNQGVQSQSHRALVSLPACAQWLVAATP